MQIIMFNDKVCLTKATLLLLKEMTRRIAYDKELKHTLHTGWDDSKHLIMCDGWMKVARSKYAVGEVVAIAQSYKTLLESEYLPNDIEDKVCELVRSGHAGCTNKMFVSADLMPKRIRITNIKLERLQDISDEDCLREGILIDKERRAVDINIYAFDVRGKKHINRWWFPTAKLAFSTLIDYANGKGTWESNPYVFAYSFELV